MTKIIFFMIMLSVKGYTQVNAVSNNPILFYNQTAFDADTCCWRKLSADQKYLDAAHLIVAYLESAKPTNRHSLHWHAGQMFAMAHSYDMAKKYIRQTYSLFYKWFGDADAKTWYFYAKGTIAFMDNDRKALEAIIKKWRDTFPTDNNFQTLIRLNNNWGMPYDLALEGG